MSARRAFTEQGHEVQYLDVRADPKWLTEMLEHSGGRRSVPVIVDEAGKVTIGYGGT